MAYFQKNRQIYKGYIKGLNGTESTKDVTQNGVERYGVQPLKNTSAERPPITQLPLLKGVYKVKTSFGNFCYEKNSFKNSNTLV